MSSILVTVVRHGESTDNVQPIWAGHRDAPLSSHGLKQADRLGKSLAKVPITAIYCSDLKRAHTTASYVQKHNLSHPELVGSPLMREQFFGVAEGQPYLHGPFAYVTLKGVYEPSFKHEEGESLEDVARRARATVRAFILPHLLSPETDQHVFIVAHGHFCDQALGALGAPSSHSQSSGFVNTGWAQLELSLLPDHPGTLAEPIPELKPPRGHELASKVDVLPERGELPPYLKEGEPSPAFVTKVIALNQSDHLEGLVKVDEAEGAADPNFFGGGKIA